MSKPWMKFYPADWHDQRLRKCSLEARGLWIDMMTYMHEATPYGHLLIADEKPSITELALQVARPPAEVKRAMAELEARGVFSKTDDGVIFSRRMVRDFQKAEEDKANGKGGGNPGLKPWVNPPVKPTNSAPVNGEDKAQWNVGSTSSTTTLESKEDSEEQACGRKSRKRGDKTPLPADFVPNFHVATRLGWDKAKQNLELERFCASAKAHDRRYVNWQAAFDNWCVSPFQKQETTDGLDRESGKRDFRQAHRELKAFGEAPADGEPSGETVRLLSAAGIRE